MKYILVLPGNSARHAVWVKQFSAFDNSDYTFLPVTYAHWEVGGEFIDLDAEAERLLPILKEHNISGVVGKSIGSVFALRLLAEGLVQPEFCVFAGYPYKALGDTDLPVAEWLAKCAVPVKLLQNSDDPLGSFMDVKEVLRSYKAISCIEVEGNTHDYEISDIMQYVPAS